MRIFLSTVLLVMVTAGVLRAHEDTVIHLEGHSLVGLPREFQPASFKAEDGTLTVSGKTLWFSRK